MRTFGNLRENKFPNNISFKSNFMTNTIINKTSNSKNMKQNKHNADVNKSIATEAKNENIFSELTLNPFKSMGKLMYESDDLPIDYSFNNFENKSSDEEIECVGIFNAGPSGLNEVNNTIDSFEVSDLSPTINLDPNDIKFDEIVFDSEININTTVMHEKTNSETITIGDLSDSNSDSEEDVEIIKVKFYSEPIELDSEIEVLSEILTPTEVIDLMKNNLRVVQQITKLSFTTMRVIMGKYKWNKDHFVNEFCEFGIETILNALKIVISKELKINAKKRKTSVAEEVVACIVCYDELNRSQMFASTCNHCLCIECWNNYITTKVNDSSSDDRILCPSESCSQLIDDEDLINLIQDQNVRDRYQRFISHCFVTNNQCLRWCPNGSCLHAVKVKYSGFQDIECICKTVFCFLCGEQWHEPLSCELYKNWIQKYASQAIDQQSADWLTKHTKCCPKCKFPIEKNGGCNYVMCTKCKHQFCYYCLGKCSHGRCVGANQTDAIAAQNEDMKVKQDLQLYPFYKDSYQNHSKQLGLERQLQAGVSRKLEKAVKCLDFKSALKFLKSAFGVLCHCRQTLMYSYVFGYYLNGPQIDIQTYIDLLAELEKETIALSAILTHETTVIHKDSVIEMKRTVQNSYKTCEFKRSALVQHIKHGLTSNKWQFICRLT